jgi:hypothetical protein
MSETTIDDLEFRLLQAQRDLQSQQLTHMQKRITFKEKERELARLRVDMPITEQAIATCQKAVDDLTQTLATANLQTPLVPEA